MSSPMGAESWASTLAIRHAMRGNRSRDTRPELAVRRAAYRLGLRYRVNVRPVPTLRHTADMVFSRAKVAVFIDGCFWHGCPHHYRAPASNQGYWSTKVINNQCRDEAVDSALSQVGWIVVRVWEHDDPETVAHQIAQLVKSTSPPEHSKSSTVESHGSQNARNNKVANN
jgi:DNA mismatch endonuclease, patch repair protein